MEPKTNLILVFLSIAKYRSNEITSKKVQPIFLDISSVIKVKIKVTENKMDSNILSLLVKVCCETLLNIKKSNNIEIADDGGNNKRSIIFIISNIILLVMLSSLVIKNIKEIGYISRVTF